METIAGIFTIIGGILGWTLAFLKFKYERKDKFRMAAIEKRLEAHQKAYAQCTKFIEVIDSRDEALVHKVFKEGQEFMSNYAIYLERETRKKFIEALGVVNAYLPKFKYFSEFPYHEREEKYDKFIKEIEKIFNLARVILQEVELEPLVESTRIKQKIRSEFDDIN